uniref:Phage integrase family protein n=1 Tax=Marinomonas sp. (strain MWYL1) TaxID=400668 RepID=A6W336_MARMS
MNYSRKKLHTPINELIIFNYSSMGKITTKDVSRLPHIVFPDNSPCLIANLYMLALTDRKGKSGRRLSQKGRNGGTIGDYAVKVAQLIRFCYFRNIPFQDMNDDRFCEFMTFLRSEKDPRNPLNNKKEEPTVTMTGRVCLDFLYFVGEFFGDKNFVATNGVIRASQKIFSPNGNDKAAVTFWNHHSFSLNGRIKTRKPVSSKNIELLYDAIYEIGSSRFVQHRREVQLDILQNTGARRGEINEITVNDVVAASTMKEPMLRLMTLKREEGSQRFIPVNRMFINDLLKYIRISRSKIIKNTIGESNDHGYLFVSEKGKHLSAETLSSEMYILRKFSKIEEQVCNQMFRHTFCTNLFVLLIERHEFENEDKFRQQLLSESTFKAEVRQYTGHKSVDSLDVYIKQAFARISGYKKTVSSAELIRAIQFFDDKQFNLLLKLEKGCLSLDEYKNDLYELKLARDKDITSIKEKSDRDFSIE